MSNEVAIKLTNVTKTYKIYPSNKYLMLEAFGLFKYFPNKKKSFDTFKALDSINLILKKGERIGIIGRNGAGKSTILKLITGNFVPTKGSIQVNGNVQAMMQTGLGFHNELSGRENIRASLLYNNLSEQEVYAAEQEIIEFCELGDFIDYPVKTYSLGMLSRLQFACSTAIRPDILIVDEVLGAGDAYFSGKSAYRMEKLTNSGCTLLLVSHSMTQILQFCEHAIWVENGAIVASGKALNVVKSYEEYINKLTKSENTSLSSCRETGTSQKKVLLKSILGEVNLAENAISQWSGSHGLKIKNISLLDKNKQSTDCFKTYDPFTIKFEYTNEAPGLYTFTAVAILFAEDGRIISRFVNQPLSVTMKDGQVNTIELFCKSLILGNGSYIFSVALYKKLDLQNLSAAEPYDLLSRCFNFKVISDDRFDPTLVHIPAVWELQKESLYATVS
tara:strand:+ start:56252 stop:57592 length:1341 start_codon:yes stop_codon:yes gene_type:complete